MTLKEVAQCQERYGPLVGLLERLGIAAELVKVLVAEGALLAGKVQVEAEKLGFGFLWAGFVDYCRIVMQEQRRESTIPSSKRVIVFCANTSLPLLFAQHPRPLRSQRLAVRAVALRHKLHPRDISAIQG